MISLQTKPPKPVLAARARRWAYCQFVMGRSVRQIARALGVTPATVEGIIRDRGGSTRAKS